MSKSQPVNADHSREADRRFDPAEWRGIIARYTGPDTLRSLRQVAVVGVAVVVYSWWLLPVAGVAAYVGLRLVRARRAAATVPGI